MICYSIDVARKLTTDDNICVTTDDDDIIKVVEDYGLKVPCLYYNSEKAELSNA